MDPLKEYLIPFYGLKDGNHSYAYELKQSFFETFPHSEITEANIVAKIELMKRPDMLTLDFVLEGTAKLICDRCGEEYDQVIEGDRQLVVNLNADHYDDEDDLVALPASTHEINIAQWLYEFVTLLIPARRVHHDKPDGSPGCDPEMLARLDELRVHIEEDKKEEKDPRWDALKNLKFDQ